MKTQTFTVRDMFCEQCEKTISRHIEALPGIEQVSADFKSGEVKVSFDDEKSSEKEISAAIEKSGYTLKGGYKINTPLNGISILVIIFALWYIMNAFGLNGIFQKFPEATDGMNYFMLFVIGLLTSFHCIAMCGGLNLAGSLQDTKASRSAILYNVGRLISYSLIGGLLGLLGSAFAITLKTRAVIGILAAIVMVIMGVKMMNCFPVLKKLYLPMPKSIRNRLFKKTKGSSFLIGLVNGFMPCGPLQTMQLTAIAAGSFLSGSLSLFFFCLGTIPLMLVFGIIAGTLKNKAKEIMALVGGTLIVVFGVYMLQNNLALTGLRLFPSIGEESAYITAMQGDNEQTVYTVLDYGSYENIRVKANVRVVWTVYAEKDKLNGCNNEIVIPEYNVDVKLHEGENLITFTPTKTGTVNYSCWMGMIRAEIIVE